MYRCPECEGEINQASEICPRCGADLALLAEAALAAEPSKPRSTPRLLLIWVWVIVVIAGGIYLFVWYVLPEYSATESPQQAEVRAIDALRAVQSSLTRYAAAEGHFPESLEPLGEQAKTAAQSALRGGYTLQYVPGGTVNGGTAHTYSLTARPTRYSLLNFYIDQTGTIHMTHENRAALPTDPTL
ncbi:MAG: hypothetical protein AUI53_03985 [Acidobacteria bacterium 13_1_40CM_2_60_7]|nr:MAG: hypothetical protein AUI53_03985 [Acidobacteria bacterium 13_1_40CM_2_60_7]